MPRHHLRYLLDRALEHRLIQAGEIINGTVLLRLLGDWVDMDEYAAVQFLQTLLSIEADSQRRIGTAPYRYA